MEHFERGALESCAGLDADVERLARELQAAAKAARYEIRITETFRSAERQEELWRQGRTMPGRKVTGARRGKSWHQYRRAFDVCFVSSGKATWEGPWESLGQLAEELGLEWGGRWQKQDVCHFQHRGGRTIDAMRKQYGDQKDAPD